jgi:hypothetical protein
MHEQTNYITSVILAAMLPCHILLRILTLEIFLRNEGNVHLTCKQQEAATCVLYLKKRQSR